MKNLKLFFALITISLKLSFAQGTDINEVPVKTVKLPMIKSCEAINPLLIEVHFECISRELYVNYFYKYNIFKQLEKLDENLYYSTISVPFTKEGTIGEVTITNSSHPQLDLGFKNYLDNKLRKVKIIAPAQSNKGEAVDYVLKYPYTAIFNFYHKKDTRWNELTIYTLIDPENQERFEVRHDKTYNFSIYQTTNGQNKKLMQTQSLTELFENDYYNHLLLQSSDHLLMAERVVDGVHYKIYYSNEDNISVDVYKVIGGKDVFVTNLNKGHLDLSRTLFRVVRN